MIEELKNERNDHVALHLWWRRRSILQDPPFNASDFYITKLPSPNLLSLGAGQVSRYIYLHSLFKSLFQSRFHYLYHEDIHLPSPHSSLEPVHHHRYRKGAIRGCQHRRLRFRLRQQCTTLLPNFLFPQPR